MGGPPGRKFLQLKYPVAVALAGTYGKDSHMHDRSKGPSVEEGYP